MGAPAILFVKPGQTRPNDKGLLRKGGVLVVEVEDPHAVNFVLPETLHADVAAGLTLRAAMIAIKGASHGSMVGFEFAAALADLILQDAKP